MINVLCLYFAQKPFSTLSRDACSINSSSVNQERLSVLTKPREFEINIVSKNSCLGDVCDCDNSVPKSLCVEDSYAF